MCRVYILPPTLLLLLYAHTLSLSLIWSLLHFSLPLPLYVARSLTHSLTHSFTLTCCSALYPHFLYIPLCSPLSSLLRTPPSLFALFSIPLYPSLPLTRCSALYPHSLYIPLYPPTYPSLSLCSILNPSLSPSLLHVVVLYTLTPSTYLFIPLRTPPSLFALFSIPLSSLFALL